ncbi:major facilitator superfamily domain-containing protein 3-like [Mizuhopecten yessoensis]|uniref:Major facilitator superfamily domain-containing protein 3 n=1 Tax=Mizuhopecten yessoensis TaxID=6573 RepID=A0A210Q317_MIZYE|nr:major facilitator superfamily domain-containing protein 3-like [Mizuhopecten yessoensis]XP_021368465.1 major facilitator superfamily domain-containing protein 3-like [Mizuhopecten yessoensis]OWF43148.1 Major facilitator superfamily domain-containing protein 3 [Mizuhopecten yessoensis]
MMRNILLLAILYFLQGLPYGLQAKFLPVYFRSHGMSLTNISLFKLLLLPWMCKALWAPYVDHYGTKRDWLMWSMSGLAVTCLLGAFSSPELIISLACVLFLFNLLTSTQDIAVDGIAIQILSSSELAYGNIAQVVGYKAGTLVSGGVLTWLSDHLPWAMLFLILVSVYSLSTLLVTVSIPHIGASHLEETEKSGPNSQQKNTDEKDEQYRWFFGHLTEVYRSPGTKWIIVFVLLYKLGEQGAISMVPLFLVDKDLPMSKVGFWTGMVGQVVSILGSFLGGWLLSHLSWSTVDLLKVSCMMRLFPAFSQILVVWLWSEEYATLCYVLSILGMLTMLLISGIVTTATFTMMMQCSQLAPSRIQATHYTVLATLEVLGKLTFSIVTGPITDLVGYRYVYLLFIALTALLLPLFKHCPPSLEEKANTNKNH